MGRTIFAVLVLIVCLSECTKDHSQNQGCSTCPTISFKTDIIPIFQANCAIPGCHTGPYPTGSLTLDSAVAYTQATAVMTGYVKPGNPNGSILYLQLIAGGNPVMPPAPALPLDACTSSKISCWIQQGALNN
ncbi:MAG: hypothetical protein JWO06_1791 [Bacteroidota bacterium]|nr:hypothetical protein [Bacteroidota bacterium]